MVHQISLFVPNVIDAGGSFITNTLSIGYDPPDHQYCGLFSSKGKFVLLLWTFDEVLISMRASFQIALIRTLEKISIGISI